MKICQWNLLQPYDNVLWEVKVGQVWSLTKGTKSHYPCTYQIISYFFIYNKYIFITCMPGAGINLSSLSILDGKVCWDLYIDGLVISMDGNILDALGAAIKVCVNYLFIFQKYRILGVLFISYLFSTYISSNDCNLLL